MKDKNIARLENIFSKFHSIHKYRKHEILLRSENDPAGVFFLKKGLVRMYFMSETGKEITFNIFKPDSCFPLIWAIAKAENIYYFETLTEVEIWQAPQSDLVTIIKKDPDLLFYLTKNILTGINGLLSTMQYLLFGDAKTKVSAVILQISKRFGEKDANGEILIQIPFTHQDIASLAGLTRETTSLEIEALVKQKIISYKKRLIQINNISRLENYVSVFNSAPAPDII